MTAPDNQRREPRLMEEIAVFIDLQSTPDSDQNDDICITKTLDISGRGIKVLGDAPLPIKSFHQLCIEVLNRRFFLVGQVAWVTELDEHFSIGFELIESEQTQIKAWQEYINQRKDK